MSLPSWYSLDFYLSILNRRQDWLPPFGIDVVELEWLSQTWGSILVGYYFGKSIETNNMLWGNYRDSFWELFNQQQACMQTRYPLLQDRNSRINSHLSSKMEVKGLSNLFNNNNHQLIIFKF